MVESKAIAQQFGLRYFLNQFPDIAAKVFTPKLLDIIESIAPNCNFSIKSIYFDKPPHANWIVNWHQDLTINLMAKKEIPNYKNWRVLKERTVVQPDLAMLNSIFTIRIHLDDCLKENGALRVIEQSHKEGVITMKECMVGQKGKEQICEVNRGGILILKPLLLHASKRTENLQKRRVIHIEFTDKALPKGLHWKEKLIFKELN